MKTPINAQTLKHHFTYHWWAYLLAIVAGTFLVNLLFTVTTPRIPENRRVDLYIYGYSDEASLNAYMENIRVKEMPDMEVMSSVTFYPDANYGQMTLVTHIAAQEGDVYYLPREDFLSYSSSEAFLPLEDDAELMAIFTEAGLDLRRGWRTLPDSDETHLYGIPTDLLPGLAKYCYVDNGYLTVLAAGGNDENALKFLRILCRDMLKAPESEASESPSPTPEANGKQPGNAGLFSFISDTRAFRS